MSLDKLHGVAENNLKDGLKSLGFDMSKHVSLAMYTPCVMLTFSEGLEALFPHHLGHYIGLAVHDAPGYSRTGKLKKGQCITIEP